MAATVRHGSSAGDWGTKPIRLAARAAWGLAPATVTVPVVGSSRPPTIRSNVVFPLPLGPRTVTISPGSTPRSIGARASTVPNDFATPVSSMAPVTRGERTEEVPRPPVTPRPAPTGGCAGPVAAVALPGPSQRLKVASA